MIVLIDILKFIFLTVMTFFSCQVITHNQKRISYIGTVLICFSIAVLQYINSGLLEAIFFGELIFVSIDRILENSKLKYLFAILIPVGILGFLLLSNVSFQISIGIPMIVLIIWRLLEFRSQNKEQKENLKKLNGKKGQSQIPNSNQQLKLDRQSLFPILVVGILISIILGAVLYKYNPIKSLKDASGISFLTNYSYNMFVMDRPYAATFISVFPIGLFIGIYYIFKDENKHLNFIVPSVIVSILELIVIASNIKLAIIPNYILALGFSLLQIYMIVYIFANIEERLFTLVKAAYISLFFLVVVALIPMLDGLNRIILNFAYLIFTLEAYIVLNYSDKRFWRLASWVFTAISALEFIGYFVINFIV